MDKAVLAWTAGIIDGEGYIGVHKNLRDGKYLRHQLRVSVKMTHKPTIELLHKMYKGNYREVKRYGNRKQQYNFELNARSAGDFLKLIYPYLFTKKAHAKIGIEFQDKLVKNENKLKLLDDKNFNRREEIYLAFKNLNRRGIEIERIII